MNMKILSSKDHKKVKKIQEKYDITRVIDIKAKKGLKVLELISSYGIFRAYGKNRKEALKNSQKLLKKAF